MPDETASALKTFTAAWCQRWQDERGHEPASETLYGIPSPCVVKTADGQVFWQPQPFVPAADLRALERAFEIQIQPDITAFYTTQFAGEMTALFQGQPLVLSQVWSPEDFVHTQQHLTGHLLMKRRFKQSPTLFIATTPEEQEVISFCNLTGAVILEQPGNKKLHIMADSLGSFLAELQPLIA